MVYGLAKRGAALMRREFDIPFRELEWTDKPNSVGRIFLEHTLMVAEGLIAVQTTCLASKGAVRYLSAEELGVVAPFRWNVTVQVRRLGLVPDGVFGLEYRDALPEHSRVICFLEADRGTMPITRSNPHLSCFARKLDAYMALWKRGEFEKKFGTRRVAVHTVTETAERASNIAAAVAKLPQGRGLFACHVLAEITPIATAILQHASPRDKNLKSC